MGSKVELPVSSPEFTGLRDDIRVDVEGDTSENEEFDDATFVFETALCVIEVVFLLIVRCVGVEFEGDEPSPGSLVVDRAEGEDVRSLSLEACVLEFRVLALLLPVAVLCMSVEFEGADIETDDVMFAIEGDEVVGSTLLEVFEMELWVLELLFPLTVGCVRVEVGDTDPVFGSVELVTVGGEIIESMLLEVFGTRLCDTWLLLPVIVRFPMVELDDGDSTFGSVELATVGDEDRSNPSLEALGMTLEVDELLLPVMSGRTAVGVDVDHGVLELAAAADVCSPFEESNVGISDFESGAGSFGFEIDAATLVVLDALRFSVKIDVEFKVKAAELDSAGAVSEETEIGVEREVPEAPEEAFDDEELLTRSVDKVPGSFVISLVAEKLCVVAVEESFAVELVKFQLGGWTSVS
jgi:hypothetical protein